MKTSLRYRVDSETRSMVMRVMNFLTTRAREEKSNLWQQEIKKILLVRSISRLGDSILAIPAILLFRKNFPEARIDFVGSAMSKRLFENLPINHHYEVFTRFPKVCWSYAMLLKRLRSVGYDLAVEVSGSSAAMGSFIVGFSGARLRAGIRGKWDRWFNLRVVRPVNNNKYVNLPEILSSMGLQTESCYPSLILSTQEKERGKRRIAALAGWAEGPIVGIFAGGRKARGKRWAEENFLALAAGLRERGARVIIFVGPEEAELLDRFKERLMGQSAVVFEPDLRMFAAMVAGCDLFVACDSGPVHLGCAVGVRTVAIFLNDNFGRWGPPPALARIVFRDTGATIDDVQEACRCELADLSNARCCGEPESESP